MKKSDIVRRIICMMLALTLLFAALPMNALAAEVGAIANNSEDPDINSTNTGNSNTSTNGGASTPSEPNKYPTSSGKLPEDQNNPEDELIGDIITTEDGYRIQMNGDRESYSIIEYFGVSKNVVIPSSYRGKPITKILDSAFYGNKTAQKITIPESVVFIGEYTFYNLSESYVYNEYGQGKYIGSTNNPYYYFVAPKDKNDTEITLHDDTAIVGSYAFAECENIKTVTIGNNVISMGYAVFGKDSKVENITIPFIGENGNTEYNAHFGYIFGARTTGGNISYVPLTLRSVTVNGGSYIKQNAMYGVDMIESLTLPFLGATINDTENNYLSYVFGGASYADNIVPQSIKNVSVLDGEIGYGAFYELSSIKTISLSETITAIPDYAFYGAVAMETCDIPENVVAIGNHAFENSGLTQIAFSKNVTQIGERAFASANGLDYLSIDSQNVKYYVSNNCLIQKDTKQLILGTNNSTIPMEVVSISGEAFNNCRKIISFVIPETVTYIGCGAFNGCASLESITVPFIGDQVRDIYDDKQCQFGYIFGSQEYEGSLSITQKYNTYYGIGTRSVEYQIPEKLRSITVTGGNILSGAFSGCKNVTEINIPDNLEVICSYTFEGCSSLTSVEIERTIEKIESSAFEGCTGLSSVKISDMDKWCRILFYDKTSNPLFYAHNLYLNDKLVTDIAFTNQNTYISNYVFVGCSSIKTVTIANGTTTIGEGAFACCTGLTKIEIPDTVAEIKATAFSGCSNLVDVTLSNNITKIGYRAFFDCDSLKYNEYENAYYLGSSNNPYIALIAPKAYYVTSCEINKNTKIIAPEAFASFSDFTSIDIPESVVFIGESAFIYCSGLTSITLPKSILFIEASAFYGCTSLLLARYNGTQDEWNAKVDVHYSNTPLTNALVFEGESYAVYRALSSRYSAQTKNENSSNIQDTPVARSTTRATASTGLEFQSNGDGTCYVSSRGTCTSTKIVIPSVSPRGDIVVALGDKAFYNTGITSIEIPSGVTKIGANCFYSCDYLSSITLPDTILEIGLNAFSSCTRLKNVYFSGGIDKWLNISLVGWASNPLNEGASLYFNGELVTSIKIPNNIETINACIFYGCKSLTNISIPSSVKSIGNSAFSGCTNLATVTLNTVLTSIGDYAFSNCASLTSITIPESITTIGASAFKGCTNLTRVNILNLAKWNSIMFQDAFSNPLYVAGDLYLNNRLVTEVVFPEGTTAINSYVFAGCTSIMKVDIPESLVSIGENAFQNCDNLVAVNVSDIKQWNNISFANLSSNPLYCAKNLYVDDKLVTEMVFSEDVTEIGKYAFAGCTSLSTVTIPSGVIVIGASAFYQCTGLTNINLSDGIESVGASAFESCSGLLSINLPDSVKSIGSRAFYWCSKLTSIDMPNGITGIEKYMFYGCAELLHINLPENITYIENSAFYNCKKLISIDMPDKVESIGTSAFYGCTNLISVKLSESLNSIGSNAFYNCYKLVEVVNDSSISLTIGATDNGYVAYYAKDVHAGESSITNINGYLFYTFDGKHFLLGYAGTQQILILPESYNGEEYSIYSYAFYAIPMTSVTIPVAVKEIGTYAFSGCEMIEKVEIVDLTNWCQINFGNITSNPLYYGNLYLNGVLLKELLIPNEVKRISDYAFYSCSNISSVTIGENVKSIGNYAFAACPDLVVLTVSDGVTSIGSYAFNECTRLESVEIGKNVKQIGTNAFYLCSNLKSVNIQNLSNWAQTSFENVCSNPLYYCGKLYINGTLIKKLDIPYGTSKISNYAFYGCNFITDVLIPDSVATVGSSAFYECYSLTRVTIGKKVTSIGSSAFYNCKKLVEVINTSSLAINKGESSNGYVAYYANEVHSSDSKLITVGDYVFYEGDVNYLISYIGNDTEITLPESYHGETYEIKAYAFEGNIFLKKVSLPAGITKIGNYAFSGCTSLVEVVLSDGITSIGDYAFRDCVKLTTIKMSNTVTSIGTSAFYNCTNIVSIYLPSSLTSIGSSAFYQCRKLIEVINESTINLTVGTSSYGYVAYYAKEVHTGESKIVDVNDYLFYTNDGIHYLVGYSGDSKELILPRYYNGLNYRIGDYAFYNGDLVSITISQGVTGIGKYAFYNCGSLEEIYFDAIAMEDFSAGNYVFYDAGIKGSGISVIIGDEVEKIPAYLFNPNSVSSNSPRIISIEFEDSGVCTSIGDYAFAYCSYLTKLTIGEAVKTIGEGAFDYCIGIKQIYFNATDMGDLNKDNKIFTQIGEQGVQILIGKNVVRIPQNMFVSCKNINQIYFNSVNMSDYEWDNVVFPSISESLYDINLVVGKDANRIPSYLFAYSRISEVEFEAGACCSSIGMRAFYECTMLTSITIGESIQTIESSAFTNCIMLEKVYFNAIQMSDLSLFNGVFYKAGQNGNGVDVVIGRNVVRIPAYLFNPSEYSSYYAKIVSVEFADGSILNSIGYRAFADCFSIEEIYFNAALLQDLSYNDYVFSRAGIDGEGIKITIGKDVTHVPSFLFSGKIVNVSFADGSICSSIGDYAFQGALISKIVLPDGLTSIGRFAFSSCTGLTNVAIPNSLTSIGSSAFAGCTSLKGITFPEGLKVIGDEAFENCSSITSITIPSTIKEIGHSAFGDCAMLEEVCFNAVSIEKVGRSVFYCSRKDVNGFNLTVGNKVKTIPNGLFSSSNANRVVFEKNSACKTIEEAAFGECSKLTQIILPEGIISVGNSAFSYCEQLIEVSLPDTLTNIGAYAFSHCKSLIKAELGVNIKVIAYGTFSECQNLSSINLGDSIESIEAYAFAYCDALRNITIPGSVRIIPQCAFYRCMGLESITLKEGVQEIEADAFNACTNLQTVNVPNSIMIVNCYSFRYCNNIRYNEYNNGLYLGNASNPYVILMGVNSKSITDIAIHNDTIVIGPFAFSSCQNLKKITIPQNVKAINESAFQNCTRLHELYINDVVAWCEIIFDSHPLELAGKNGLLYVNGVLVTELTISSDVKCIRENAFLNCTNISGVEIADNVEAIEKGAFKGCNSIVSITVPYVEYLGYLFGANSYLENQKYVPKTLENVTINGNCNKIADYAFYECNTLVNVSLPNSVNEIGYNAFAYCDSMTSIVIPESVNRIASHAFYNCTELAEIIYTGEVNEWRHIRKASNWDENTKNSQPELLPNSGLLYETSEDLEEFYVSGYIGSEGRAFVPAMYSGRPVTIVYEKAFDGNKLVSSITLPETLVSIEEYAFRNCVNLKDINFPESLNTIEKGVLLGCTSIENLTLPFLGATKTYEDDEYIGYYFGASNYKENVLYVPHTLRSITVLYMEQISNYCFNDCVGLTEFTFNDELVSVGANALKGCNRIEVITIGSGLKEIGDFDCDNPMFGLDKSNSMLIKYIVSDKNEIYASDEFGVLYRKMDIPFKRGTESIRVEVIDVPAMANLDGYAIPDHIVSIAPYAFAYNVTLRMIDLTYVRNISNNAFYQASNLVNVTLGTPIFTEFEKEDDFNTAFDEAMGSIPEGMWEQVYSQRIGDSAFRGCHSLLKIDIDTDNIVDIGDYAFADCPSLKTIMLGKNIERLGLAVFSATANGESNIERFIVDEANQYFKSIDGVLYSVNVDTSLTLEIFPAMGVRLDMYGEPMYDENGNTLYKNEFILPQDVYVKAIQTYAFQGARELHTVKLDPVADMIVGDYAFANSSIRDVNIGDNVVSFGLIRGEGEYTVFADANSLTSITVANNNDYYSSIDGVLFDKQQRTLIKYPAAKPGSNYDIPDSVQNIASMAFKQNQSIQNVFISSYISTVGLEAFYACSMLEMVAFKNVYAPVSIMENAFTTFVEIENGEISETSIKLGYSDNYYYDGANGEVGWVNYANKYTLVDNIKGGVIKPDSSSNRNNFYAVVVLDTEGKQLGNMLVSLTDPYGKTETVRTGYGTEGEGIAMFYDLASVEGIGFALDFTQPYIIKVADPHNVYYTYESTSVYLDEEMRITYITLERKPCDVSFNVNGGVGYIDIIYDVEVDVGQYKINNQNISRAGYTLAGWATSADGVVEYTDYFSTNKYKAHYVLYAIWQPNTNTVHFDLNGGDGGSMSDISVKTDATVVLPENQFTLTGFNFIGWSLEKNGKVDYTDASEFTSGPESSYTLYACWTENENTIVFNSGGGTGEMESASVKTYYTFTIPENCFVRDGYTFDHWVDESGLKCVDGKYNTNANPVQVLTAVWNANENTVCFDANGGTGSMTPMKGNTDSTITLNAGTFMRTGYMLIGWSDEPNGALLYDNGGAYKVTANPETTLYAVWAKLPDTYGVSCNGQDINSQDAKVNIAEYYYKDGKLTDDETIEVSVIIYDNGMGYTISTENQSRAGGGSFGGGNRSTGLYQNGHKISNDFEAIRTENGYILKFKVLVADLLPEVDIEMKTLYESNEGSKASTTTFLNVHIFDFNLTKDCLVLDSLGQLNLSNYLKSDAGKLLIKFLNGDKFEFNLYESDDKKQTKDIEIKIEDDLITVSFTGTKKAGKDVESSGISIKLGGELVLKYSPLTESGLEIVSSAVVGEGAWYGESPQLPFYIGPVRMFVTIEGKLGGELKIIFAVDEQLMFDKITAKFFAELKASLGVGGKVVNAGIYGKVETAFELEIVPSVDLNRITMEADLGAFVKVAWFKYSASLLKHSGELYSKNPKTRMLFMFSKDVAAMYIADNYTNITGEDLTSAFELLIIDGEIFKLSFVDASSLEGYDSNNFVKLALTKWNGEKWEEPIILDDNGLNDASYMLYCDGSNAYAIFTQQSKKLSDEEMKNTYESFQGLSIKVVNLATGEVMNATNGACSGAVYLTQFSVVDGIPTLLWVENADNNMFGVSPYNYIDENGTEHTFATSANSIWVSKFKNGVWSTPSVIADNLSTVTDIAISSNGEVAYIIDTNGALTDSSDRVMYYGNLEGEIAAFNHVSVGSVISVEFGNEGLVYYYDVLAEDGEENDGLRILASDSNAIKETLPQNIPEDIKIVRDENGNIIAIFYFANKTWNGKEDEKHTGSALYAIFKEKGAWGKAVEISGYKPVADCYIYTYDVTCVPDSIDELMISITTITNSGDESFFNNIDFVHNMRGELIVDSYKVNYADSTIDLTVRNNGARASKVYVSIGNGYLLIDEALASGEIKTYTVSLYGNAERKYTVSIDGDTVGTADWTSEELSLNYSDIVPYAKQLLVGGKNVLLLAVKNTGNTVDTGITVIRVGEHMDNAIISAEILNAISNLTLNDGESVIIEITNENGEKEKIWVAKNEVDAYGIAYHEVLLSDLCPENIGIISIATIVTNNEKGVAVDNNFTYVSYNECVGSLEEGEKVEYKPVIFENKLEFDQQNDDGVEFNYTYSADDSVLEVYVDRIKVSNELYENTINGTRGTIVLHLELLNSLSKGTHKVTLNFASGNTCEVELKVASYYTVTVNDGENDLPEISVKEGTIPMLPTVSKAADEQYTYVFNGWDVDGDMMPDNVTAVIENTTYTAIWKEIKREYEITWVMISADGKSVSITEQYHYEEIPNYLGTIFVPDGMQFVSWNTEIDKVIQNCTYTAQYEQERQIGDINGDGVINTRDVAMLRQYVVGKIELSEDVLVYCNIYNDYNDDGSVKINTRDVALLQQIVVGTSN